MGFQLVTGLRSPARGFADNLTLICHSAEGISRLVQVVADFCNWSGMRIKIAKSVITAYDYGTRRDLPTDDIQYQGQALTSLPWTRASRILASARVWCPLDGDVPPTGPRLLPWVDGRKGARDGCRAAKVLGGLAKRHKYLLGRMVPAMVLASWFLYSAPLVLWTDVEMEDLPGVWLRVHKVAWWLTPSYAGAPFLLPSKKGRCPELHLWVILVQVLAKHSEMEKENLPTSRNVLPTFQTFCLVGVQMTVVHFAHFQVQDRKGDVLG